MIVGDLVPVIIIAINPKCKIAVGRHAYFSLQDVEEGK
jgi:hypothetical protein